MEYVIFNNQVRLATLNEIAQIVSDSAEQMQISNGFAYILPEEYTFGGDIYQLSKNFVDSPPLDVSDTIRLHALRVPMKACGKMSHDSIITADGLWAVEECVGREVTAEPWFTVGSGVRTTNSAYFGQYTPECNLQQLVNLGYTVVGPLVFNVDNVAALPDSELPYLIVGNLPFTNVLYYSNGLEVIQLQPDVVVRATPFKQSGKNYYPVTIDGVTYVVAVESQYGCNLQMLGRTVRRHRAPAHDARSRAELARHENPMFVHDARRDIRHDTRRLRLDDLNGSDELTAPRGNRCASNDTLRRKHIESTTVNTDERVTHPTRTPRRPIDAAEPSTTIYSSLELADMQYALTVLGYDVKLLDLYDVNNLLHNTYSYHGIIADNHVELLSDIQDVSDLEEAIKNPEYAVTVIHQHWLTAGEITDILQYWGFDAVLQSVDADSAIYYYNGIISPKYKELLETTKLDQWINRFNTHIHANNQSTDSLLKCVERLGYRGVVMSDPDESTARVMVDSVMSDEEVLSVLTGDTVDNTPVPSEFDSRLSVDRLKETLNRFGYKRRVKLLGICGDVKTYQYPGFIHTDVLQQIAPAADLRKIARNITPLHTMLTIDQCHEALHGNYDNAIIDISDPESTMHHFIFMGILPADILTEFESRK